MAGIVKNDKEFRVISVSAEEARELGFGINRSGECVCMHCNSIINGTIYYIAVLNDTMDKTCYDAWYRDAVRYTDDIPIEEQYFSLYKAELGI